MTRLDAMFLALSLLCAPVACVADGWRAQCVARDLARVRIGSSHVVDSAGDIWLVHGFDSDARGLLVVGVCSNDSGWCYGGERALTPVSEVVEVRP